VLYRDPALSRAKLGMAWTQCVADTNDSCSKSTLARPDSICPYL